MTALITTPARPAVKYKLRKIVRTALVDSEHGPYERDILECGHMLAHRDPDSRGEAIHFAFTKNRRRRCWKCAAGKPAEVKP
jgi:hypothetical protein